MKIAIQGKTLMVKDADTPAFNQLKAAGMTWDRKGKFLSGPASLDLLNTLAKLVRLPATAEARRRQLQAIRKAVDAERIRKEPSQLCAYPVKMPLYSHQRRAANMAMLTFGWIQKEENDHGF